MSASLSRPAPRGSTPLWVLGLIAGLVTALLGPAPSAEAHGGHTDGHRCRPAVRALPDLGGPYAEAVTFNRHHVFVGGASTPNEEHVRATYWKHDRLHVIRTGLEGDEALDINNSGLIVGAGTDSASGQTVAWAYVRGTVHRLHGMGGSTNARRVNEAGTIVGFVTTREGVRKPARWHRWWSDPQVLQLLPGDSSGQALGINDKGSVVGASVSSASQLTHPVLWNRHGRIKRLPARPAGEVAVGSARAINNRRMIAGALSRPLPTSPLQAVRWSRRTLVELAPLPGDTSSTSASISQNGWVVGTSQRSTSAGIVSRHAYFWPGYGPTLALPVLASHWASANSRAFDVDRFGTAAGTSTDDSGVLRATVWTCVQRLAFRPPAITEK